MRSSRRFSQAIAEGDGISVLAEVRDADGARAAEDAGADGLVVRAPAVGVRDATELPLLWLGHGSPDEASRAGADALLLVADGIDDDDGTLERVYRDALELGLDCVLEVRSDEELELSLERLDPEMFLLAASDEPQSLDHALELLASIPAGKLAIASIPAASVDQVAELERAGVDAVVISETARIAELVAAAPPEL